MFDTNRNLVEFVLYAGTSISLDGMRADDCSTVNLFMDCIYWDSASIALLEEVWIAFNYWIKAFGIYIPLWKEC